MGRATSDRPPRIYSYIVTHDGGFAPNPFHGWCTLACCKPAIRRRARKGDWVLGITSAKAGESRYVVYAMQIDDVLGFDEYWEDRRFRKKRPKWTSGTPTVQSVGDSCFEPRGGDVYLQHPCCHNRRGRARRRRVNEDRDLRGENVLVSRRFAYYGRTRRKLPDDLAFAIAGRGHKSRFSTDEARRLRAFLMRLKAGRHDLPSRFYDAGGRLPRGRGGCG